MIPFPDFSSPLRASRPFVASSDTAQCEVARDSQPLIFIVDDDEMIGFLIGATMESGGYAVRVFTNGAEAAMMAATLRPDLLLVDLHMPQLSGVKTIARLRELQPTLPVVVISGLSSDEARAEAPDADAFLEKPIKLKALLGVVGDLTLKLTPPDGTIGLSC
jgi:DNA-binding response OmpR family regulator